MRHHFIKFLLATLVLSEIAGCATIPLNGSLPHGAAEECTPARLLEMAVEKGVLPMLDFYASKNDAQCQFQSAPKIESGDAAWIRFAALILPLTDAGLHQELGVSLGKGVAANPVTALVAMTSDEAGYVCRQTALSIGDEGTPAEDLRELKKRSDALERSARESNHHPWSWAACAQSIAAARRDICKEHPQEVGCRAS